MKNQNYDRIIAEANRRGHKPELPRSASTGEVGELGPALDAAVSYLRSLGMSTEEIESL